MKTFKKIVAGVLTLASLSAMICVPSAFAASTGSYTESESNNTRATADVITPNSVTTGKISSSSDVDFFAITSTDSGYYDFTLSVPSGCNYNFALYDTTGMVTDTFAKSSAGVGEIGRKYIVKGNIYYIKVYSSSGYSTSKNYTLYVSPPKDNNKTWYSQTKANGSGSEYNNYNLSSSFTSRMAKDGCALTSIAMVLHNMNAKTKDKIYDSRTGYTGYMYADPYIVFMAKKGTTTTPTSFSGSIELTYNNDVEDKIGPYFNKTITRTYTTKFSDATALLDSNPQGVIVKFEQNSTKYPSHYVVLMKSGSSYVVYDPATSTSESGNGVPFNSAYAHTKMGFDTSEITQVITIK